MFLDMLSGNESKTSYVYLNSQFKGIRQDLTLQRIKVREIEGGEDEGAGIGRIGY